MQDTNILTVIQPIEVKARLYVTQIKEKSISTKADSDAACELLKSITDYRKSTESLQKEQLKPLKEQTDIIKSSFKPALDFLTESEAELRRKINSFLDSERARLSAIEAEERKKREDAAIEEALRIESAKKEADKYDAPTKAALLDTLNDRQENILEDATKENKIVLSSSVSSVRTLTDFELVDISKVPSEYLQLNTVAVRQALKNGVKDIPGVRIFQKSSVAIK